MKMRTGFVSNSSSSSFVLDKRKLTALQLNQIWNVEDAVKEIIIVDNISVEDRFGLVEYIKDWRVKEDGDFIKGYTSMDNFDMVEFINYIGANKSFITRDSDGVWFDAKDGE